MEPSVTTLSGVRVAMEETAHHPLGQREERREKINTYIISKEIHKGTKITSNPLEKLTDHCVKHKINMRKTKDVIHGHNSVAPELHFPLPSSFWCFSHFFSAF